MYDKLHAFALSLLRPRAARISASQPTLVGLPITQSKLATLSPRHGTSERGGTICRWRPLSARCLITAIHRTGRLDTIGAGRGQGVPKGVRLICQCRSLGSAPAPQHGEGRAQRAHRAPKKLNKIERTIPRVLARPRLEPGQWWILADPECRGGSGTFCPHTTALPRLLTIFRAFCRVYSPVVFVPEHWPAGPAVPLGCARCHVQRSRGGSRDVPPSGLLPGVSAQRGGAAGAASARRSRRTRQAAQPRHVWRQTPHLLGEHSRETQLRRGGVLRARAPGRQGGVACRQTRRRDAPGRCEAGLPVLFLSSSDSAPAPALPLFSSLAPTVDSLRPAISRVISRFQFSSHPRPRSPPLPPPHSANFAVKSPRCAAKGVQVTPHRARPDPATPTRGRESSTAGQEDSF